MNIEGNAPAVSRVVREICMVVGECEEVLNVLSESSFRETYHIKTIRMSTLQIKFIKMIGKATDIMGENRHVLDALLEVIESGKT